jgi:hypothetical protein
MHPSLLLTVAAESLVTRRDDVKNEGNEKRRRRQAPVVPISKTTHNGLMTIKMVDKWSRY